MMFDVVIIGWIVVCIDVLLVYIGLCKEQEEVGLICDVFVNGRVRSVIGWVKLLIC